MSIKRVDAVLRLKGLEKHWEKVSCFHTHFILVTCHQRDEQTSISLEDTLMVKKLCIISDSNPKPKFPMTYC